MKHSQFQVKFYYSEGLESEPVELVVDLVDHLGQLRGVAGSAVDEVELPIVGAPAEAVSTRRNKSGYPEFRILIGSDTERRQYGLQYNRRWYCSCLFLHPDTYT